MISERDPLQGLVDYFDDIKPYHTKIAEVRIVYEHYDDVFVTISEDFRLKIDFRLEDLLNFSPTEKFALDYGSMFEHTDTIMVRLRENANGSGWDVPAWDIQGWDQPLLTPFLRVVEKSIDSINASVADGIQWPLIGPAPDSAENRGSDQVVGVAITEMINISGGAQPTLRLNDSISVTVVETAGGIVGDSGGALVGSWDYTYWDVGGFDENLNVLINLVGNAYPPTQ